MTDDQPRDGNGRFGFKGEPNQLLRATLAKRGDRTVRRPTPDAPSGPPTANELLRFLAGRSVDPNLMDRVRQLRDTTGTPPPDTNDPNTLLRYAAGVITDEGNPDA